MRRHVGRDTTPSNVGVLIQEGIFVESDFADRFFWARTRAGLGAPTVAKKIGCSPGLISNLENQGASGSKFNDKFAKLFGVDPQWLRDGTGPAPRGYDADKAREARKKGGGTTGADVVHMADFKSPRWALEGEVAPENEEQRADALQKRMFSDFQDYAKLVGREHALALVEVFTRISALVQSASEKPEGHSK